MEAPRFSIQRVTLQAFDLSERTARAGKDSAKRRLRRLRSRSFMIIQCAVTAGLAWLLADLLIGPRPFFAAVAAIITLGFSFGQRWRRALEVSVGVAVGVGIGDLFVRFFGTGHWQIVLVCLIAMSIAVLLGAGTLMTTQAGVQAIIAITLFPDPAAGLNRWLDAVIGCVLALIVATVVPAGPIHRPGQLAASLLRDVAATLRDAAGALRSGDVQAADAVLDRARHSEDQLVDLEEASREGVAVVRGSPFVRHRLQAVKAFAELYPGLDRVSRNLRVLARRTAIALWRSESVPASYVDLLEQLADAVAFMSEELDRQQLPTRVRDRLAEVGVATSQLPIHESLSAVVVLAQIRSMTVDLLELTGLSPAEARQLIPETLD
ncbi:FUSC family protein [Microlunatus sp. Gsoil 973]|jgi:uncharacterized membrane protein YgaE (UPF0421/DUF939 family)|uniref:FUSC family protein n=1 Tax=Microlunatus sp. Gsoil 973 TaxID=2672569 RepID=UPI0012B4E450|nr:FUSC family protein [Microlunatus sp. Gsoil 973]QGN32255.1 aromatic acid exporter family protein [Microlunatus sp. Gsoil 973]